MGKTHPVFRLQRTYVVTKIAFWLLLGAIFIGHSAVTYAR